MRNKIAYVTDGEIIIGCYFDMTRKIVQFSYNGQSLVGYDNPEFDLEVSYQALIEPGSCCFANFGQIPFEYAPEDVSAQDLQTIGDMDENMKRQLRRNKVLCNLVRKFCEMNAELTKRKMTRYENTVQSQMFHSLSWLLCSIFDFKIETPTLLHQKLDSHQSTGNMKLSHDLLSARSDSGWQTVRAIKSVYCKQFSFEVSSTRVH